MALLYHRWTCKGKSYSQGSSPKAPNTTWSPTTPLSSVWPTAPTRPTGGSSEGIAQRMWWFVYTLPLWVPRFILGWLWLCPWLFKKKTFLGVKNMNGFLRALWRKVVKWGAGILQIKGMSLNSETWKRH